MAAESSGADCDAYLAKVGIRHASRLPPLTVSYGRLTVSNGQQFDRTRDAFLQTAPKVAWDASLGECTLVMIDPDAPERHGDGSEPHPKAGPWLHWIVTGATGSASMGRVVQDYAGPTPPKGNHRYILLLFKQSGEVDMSVGTARKKWDAPGFVEANASTLSPAGFSFFYVKK